MRAVTGIAHVARARIAVVANQKRVRAGPAVTIIRGAGIPVVTVATVPARRIHFKCVDPDVVVACVINFDRPNGPAEE